MPASVSAKLEKQQSSTVATAAEVVDNSPIRQVLVIVEHKIRNLEKRKVSNTLRKTSRYTKNIETDRSFNTRLAPLIKKTTFIIRSPVTHMHKCSSTNKWKYFLIHILIIVNL